MNSRRRRSSRALATMALAVGIGSAGRPALAQEEVPRVLRLGFLTASPRVTLSNVGIDTNVFNEAVNPKRDVTFVVTPAVELRMYLSRGQLTATSVPSFGYFHRYASQRTRNLTQSFSFQWPFNRVMVRSGLALTAARDRAGLEIDERVQRSQREVSVGMDVRVAPKTTMRLDVTTATVEYDQNERVAGTSLASALNRRGDAVAVSVRHARSPLTTVVLVGEWLRDEFERTPQRNTRGWRLAPGVEFARTALISGSAFVGVRSLVPVQPSVPSFRGLVGNVNLASVIRTRTRVNVGFVRDVAYSYDVTRPYYVQEGVVFGITERLGNRWDVVASLTRQRLTYRTLAASPTSPAPEQFSGISAGTGYHVGQGIRVGLDARGIRRQSAEAGRSYTAWQIGNSVSYVF